MSELPVNILVDGFVALLLGVTVVYCYLLDRRLRDLRSGQDGMKELIGSLNTASERAQASIAQLKAASQLTGEELEGKVQRARGLADELSLMVEAGNRIADRLGNGRYQDAPKEAGRAEAAPEPVPPAKEQAAAGAPDAATAKAAPSRSSERAVENELLKALRQAR